MQFRSRLIAAIAVPVLGLGIGLASAGAASAAPGQTQTIHLDGVPIDVGPATCVPGDVTITGNGVEHMTTNSTGFWVTGTLTGAADTGTGWTGHATAWFGVEDNNKSLVNHFILNAQLTGPGGSVNIHQEGQITFNAQGVPVVVRPQVTNCS